MKDGLTPEEMAARAPADKQERLMQMMQDMHTAAGDFFDAFTRQFFIDPKAVEITMVIRHKEDLQKSMLLSTEKGAELLNVIDVVREANAVRLDAIARSAPSTERMQ